MTAQDESKFVCYGCIGDELLSSEVKEKGKCAQCSYCQETREGWPLDILAHRIDEVLQEHFEITTGYEIGGLTANGKIDLIPKGKPVDEVIAEEVAILNYAIAYDVIKFLSSLEEREVIKFGASALYSLDCHYEKRSPNDLGFRYAWSEFRKEIMTRARFFNDIAEEVLNDLFGDLTNLRTIDDEPVIREFGPGQMDRFVWRARKAESPKEMDTILRAPSLEIGPPPSKLSTAGRMNAAGISVFYGALESETCVSEIRPPVGSHVIVVKFEMLRNVHLLDLNLLANVYGGGSHFNPEYVTRRGRAAFLGYLVREICRPVMPLDESFEYLPTQVVSEYLANRVTPRLDGIIYPSSQVDAEGSNLVLFNHARQVEANDCTYEVDIFEPDFLDSLEDIPIITYKKATDTSSNAEPNYIGDMSYGTEATLRLDFDSIQVKKISHAKYSMKEIRIIPQDESTNPPVNQYIDFDDLLK